MNHINYMRLQTNLIRHLEDKRLLTAPTQKEGFRVPKTVLWLMEV